MAKAKEKPKAQERPAVINESVEMVPVSRLTLHPQNVNQGDAGAIFQSIEANGFYGVVVAQRSTGRILAGNHRYEAAKMAGLGEIPVAWVECDDATALRILLADNRTARLGRDDDAALAELLAEISNSAGTLEGTGYDGDDLDQLITDLAKEGISVGEGKDYDSFSQTQELIGKSGKGDKPTFGVLVICEGEGEQAEQFERLKDEGYNCVMQGAKPPGVKR
ncbi:MAG: ParB/RepB/Spo0J family partition protein [Armatimonadetes bacterium]|nr:ParB/RepB/Spo0J family partition protein [Armatimonadota bacterium]